MAPYGRYIPSSRLTHPVNREGGILGSRLPVINSEPLTIFSCKSCLSERTGGAVSPLACYR
jgi:hypothetical protein